MEPSAENQYDDDLTVGDDEYYNDYFSTESVDLFEFAGDDESPLARLKTIILSLDWEITDEILEQFNDELLDLQDVWANDKIQLIYVQALQKISKYIYNEKANAHPNSIKLLLSFYYNLEKIVSSPSMEDGEKKELLVEDIKKFDQLKILITKKQGQEKTEARTKTAAAKPPVSKSIAPEPLMDTDAGPLTNLNAIILGMDWEITDKELSNLSEEVTRLEGEFAGNKARLIFLQGIGALGAYITQRRSESNPEAFTLLRSFYSGLNEIVSGELPPEKQKEMLLQEVGKFNAFKAEIAQPAAEESPQPSPVASTGDDVPEGVAVETDADDTSDEDDLPIHNGEVAPALFGSDEEGQAEDGADENASSDLADRLDNFFGADEETNTVVDDESDDVPDDSSAALAGVHVETPDDDDSDEEALPLSGDEVAPALSGNADEGSEEEDNEKIADVASKDLEDRLTGFFGEDEDEPIADEINVEEQEIDSVDTDVALAGVDVETPADDDSDEEPLPQVDDDEVAPALSDTGEESDESEDDEETASQDVEDRLAGFFGDDEDEQSVVEEEIAPAAELVAEDKDEALVGVDVETSADDDSDEEPLPHADDDIAPALVDTDEESDKSEDDEETASQDVEDRLAGFFGDDEDDVSKDEEEYPEADTIALLSEDVADEPEEEDSTFAAEEPAADLAEEVSFTAEEDEESEEEDITFAAEEPAVDLAEEVSFTAEEDEESEEEDITFAVEEPAVDLAEEVSFTAEEDEESEEEEDITFAAEEPAVDLAEEVSFTVEEDEESEEEDITFAAEEPAADLADTVEEDEESEEEDITFAAEEPAADLAEEVSFTVEEDEESEEEDITFAAEEPAADLAEEVSFAVEAEAEFDEDLELSVDAGIEEDNTQEVDDFSFSVPGGDISETEVISPQLVETDIQEETSIDLGFEKDISADALAFSIPGEDSVPQVQPDVVESAVIVEDGSGSEDQFEDVIFEAVDEEEEVYLGNLHEYIAILKESPSTEIGTKLCDELQALKESWTDKPVEKTFLQFMATISEYVSTHNPGPESASVLLLQEVYNDFEKVQDNKGDNSLMQELILDNTGKVLSWQQEMFTADIVTVREEQILTEETTVNVESGPADLTQVFLQEMDNLKKSLMSEIADLREELSSKK